MQIGGIIGRRVHLVEGVGRVEVVCSEGVDQLFEEAFANLGKERLFRIEDVNRSGYIGIDTPLRRVDFRVGETLFEGGRNVSRKRGENGCHTQFSLTSENLLLQLLLTGHKSSGKRPSPSIEVPHPEPSKIGRAAEKALHLFVCKTQTAVDPVPDRILSGQCQRHIDSVQGHKINLPLPAFPVPPRGSVVKCAIVEVVSIPVGSNFTNPFRHTRHRGRNV